MEEGDGPEASVTLTQRQGKEAWWNLNFLPDKVVLRGEARVVLCWSSDASSLSVMTGSFSLEVSFVCVMGIFASSVEVALSRNIVLSSTRGGWLLDETNGLLL